MNGKEILAIVRAWSGTLSAIDGAYRELVCQARDEEMQWDDYEGLSTDEREYLVGALELRHLIEQAAGIVKPELALEGVVYDDLCLPEQRARLGRFESVFLEPSELVAKDSVSEVYPSYTKTSFLLFAFLRSMAGEARSSLCDADDFLLALIDEPVSVVDLRSRWAVFLNEQLFSRWRIRDVAAELWASPTNSNGFSPLGYGAVPPSPQHDPRASARGDSVYAAFHAPAVFEYMGLEWRPSGALDDENTVFELDVEQFDRWRGYAAARYAAGLIEMDVSDDIIGHIGELPDLPGVG